jgi:hypothetical protein
MFPQITVEQQTRTVEEIRIFTSRTPVKLEPVSVG